MYRLRLLIPSMNLGHIRLCPRNGIRRSLLRDGLLPRNAGQPIKEESAKDVEDDESPHDAEIPPSRAILTAQQHQILVRAGSGAESAVGCSLSIGEVTACRVDVVLHVLTAGLTGGWVEAEVFDRGADDGGVGEAGGKHA